MTKETTKPANATPINPIITLPPRRFTTIAAITAKMIHADSESTEGVYSIAELPPPVIHDTNPTIHRYPISIMTDIHSGSIPIP